MAARAIWTGDLHAGLSSVPVKLYAAVQDRSIRFHLLDRRTRTRVKQHMVKPDSGEEVPREQIRRGLEVEPGTFVVLDDEELQSLEPEPSRDIRVTRFVPTDRINHQWYDRPYFLGPGEDDASSYFALAEALEKEELEGVAEWVMRKKRYLGALRADGGYLLLVTLRNTEEVLLPQELPAVSGRAPDPRELKMAEQLIAALEDDFRPADFRDEYRDRVMDLIQAKARGEKPKLAKMPRRAPATALLGRLEASLKAAKRTKGGAAA